MTSLHDAAVWTANLLPIVQHANSPALAALGMATGRHSSALLRLFFSFGVLGVFLVSIVDSSFVPLPIPGLTDIMCIVIAAQRGGWPHDLLLLTLATLGSAIGGFVSYHAGHAGGIAFLEKKIPPRIFKRVTRWMESHAILAVALPAILPPPMPLSPFVLAAGALNMSRRKFMATFTLSRLLRHAFAIWLGIRYGSAVLGLWAKFSQKWAVPVLIVLWVGILISCALALRTIYTTTRSVRGSRPSPGHAAPLASKSVSILLIAISLAACAPSLPAHAAVALLVQEPYGEFGAFNPTGHAAIYLSGVCAETPTQLRPCKPGEFGAVISRYHRIDGYDWLAIPLIPYLYAVESSAQIPSTIDRPQLEQLRDTYWRQHLAALAPPTSKGSPPAGDWIQLIGASYLRKIYAFEADSTPLQDRSLIDSFNNRRNISHFNLFFHNCADFSRVVLDLYYPHSIHRNFIADAGLTTPKQLARSMMRYGKRHPEIRLSEFVIPQIPGDVPRSHSIDGVAESLVKSKKYILPLALLHPEVAGAVAVSYLTEGRLRMPKDAAVFAPEDLNLIASNSLGRDSRRELGR